jgi:hypothetical protein
MVSMWIALALQAAQSGGAGDGGPAVPPAQLTLLPVCPPADSSGDIVVCGRTDPRNDQRLRTLDPRFEPLRLPDGRYFRRFSGGFELEGGGPKGSVGLTLRTKF